MMYVPSPSSKQYSSVISKQSEASPLGDVITIFVDGEKEV